MVPGHQVLVATGWCSGPWSSLKAILEKRNSKCKMEHFRHETGSILARFRFIKLCQPSLGHFKTIYPYY